MVDQIEMRVALFQCKYGILIAVHYEHHHIMIEGCSLKYKPYEFSKDVHNLYGYHFVQLTPQCKIWTYLPEKWEVKTLEGLMLSWVLGNKCRGFVVKKAKFH